VESKPSPTQQRISTRRVTRYRTDIPLIVHVSGKEDLRVHGRCFEIGEGGLGAVITSEFPAGEMVSLELSLPQASDVHRLRAVVRHRMGFLHGFEFLGLQPEQREVIRAYCRSLAAI
jgi:c-di-GMP-binding flagellar brake protein YcgR